MPLSEEEQRILYEIERSFYEQDPEFADRVRSETVYVHAGRQIKWAALGFLVGLVLLLVSFTSYLVLGFAGFLIMLGSALLIERNARRMGRAGLADLAAATRERGVPGVWDDARQRFRSRFRRER